MAHPKTEEAFKGAGQDWEWWQDTTGRTGLDNPIAFTESPSDICFLLEPTVKTQVRFNPEMEQNETIIRSDVVYYLIQYTCGR